jgi:hypothetical protein
MGYPFSLLLIKFGMLKEVCDGWGDQ